MAVGCLEGEDIGEGEEIEGRKSQDFCVEVLILFCALCWKKKNSFRKKIENVGKMKKQLKRKNII